MTSNNWSVSGNNVAAQFTLTIHRGESMVLLAMNWRKGMPPENFVGFAIEYKEPGGNVYFALKNRLSFPGVEADERGLSTLHSPIQKFRWVHFPRHAELAGEFTYKVTPVFMGEGNRLEYGEFQMARLTLGLETYVDELNVAFTRGYVSSQKFARSFLADGHRVATLLPARADEGLSFTPTHPKAAEALRWMGFEARNIILRVLDDAVADQSAQVSVIAYELNEPEVLARLLKLGKRLRIIIDDSDDHGLPHSAESLAASALEKTAGAGYVVRQDMASLQHNKTLVVDGDKCKAVVCGSTNFSWRGFFVQANNAIVLRGAKAVRVFGDAFETYFTSKDDAERFRTSVAAGWSDLSSQSVNAAVTFSPHGKNNRVLGAIARHLQEHTKSSVLFGLAFLSQAKDGAVQQAMTALTKKSSVFVYGMSDKEIGMDLRMANGHMALVQPAILAQDVPEPFAQEVAGGGGVRLHHKFIVTDFDTPDARVYMGSFNFSEAADLNNGENLLVIHDRRVATAYMVEAIRIFDHYEFRVRHAAAKEKNTRLTLKLPPDSSAKKPWWHADWTEPLKIRDRELFSKAD